MTDAEFETLSILSEECGEVVQVIGKIMRHGMLVDHPTMGKWDNATNLRQEMADVMQAISLVVREFDMDAVEIAKMCEKKHQKLKKYTHYIDWNKHD